MSYIKGYFGGKMVTTKTVERDMCVRVAGEVKCVSKGYSVKYHKAPGTVGPIEVTVKYP